MPFESFFAELSAIEHEVCGKQYRYYPASAKVLLRIKPLGKSISRLINTLSDRSRFDAGSTTRTWKSNEEDGTSGEEIQVNPTTESMAEFRMRQKEKAIEDLIEKLLAEDSQALIGYILINSLRDEFKDMSDPPTQLCKELVNDPNMTVEMLKGHLQGVIKANERVLGPLVKTVSQKFENSENLEMPQEEEVKNVVSPNLVNLEDQPMVRTKKTKKKISGQT